MLRDFVKSIVGASKEDREQFFMAAYTGKTERVVALYDAGGIDIDSWGPAGQHALYKSVLAKSRLTAQKLLERGADPNRLTEPGYAAIHEAANTGQDEMLLELLCGGADPNLKSVSGASAISYACAKGHAKAALVLVNKGADLTVVHS